MNSLEVRSQVESCRASTNSSAPSRSGTCDILRTIVNKHGATRRYTKLAARAEEQFRRRLPVVAAEASLLGWIGGGLFWLAAGILCALAVSTTNAWVLLVEVVRDARYQPIEGAP